MQYFYSNTLKSTQHIQTKHKNVVIVVKSSCSEALSPMLKEYLCDYTKEAPSKNIHRTVLNIIDNPSDKGLAIFQAF